MTNPFGTTFESLEGPTSPVVETIHQKAFARLGRLIDSGDGRLISLRAPRAGYGKTMLLSRFREKNSERLMIVPIHLVDGRRVEGEAILEALITQMTETVSGTSGLSRLDLHTRGLFSQGLLPLVDSGEVPCQDKEGALSSLSESPAEAFDFHQKGASIAQWTKEQFGVLLPRLSTVIGKSAGVSARDTAFWLEHLFRYATHTPGEPSRIGDLIEAVFGPQSRFRSGAGFLDGLGSFLNLITLVEPVVLVLDEVDGLSGDTDSAMRATSCLVSLWEAVPRLSVVVSVNDDVWDSAFAPRLPLGLRDRLEDTVIRLGDLSSEEAKALISLRGGADADQILDQLTLDSAGLYPRGVLRVARDLWESDGDDVETFSLTGKMPPASMPDHQALQDVDLTPRSASITREEVTETSDFVPEVDASFKVEPPTPAIPSKPVYPPTAVKRASIPKRFNIQYSRPKLAPSPKVPKAQFDSPFKIATPAPVSRSQPIYPPASIKRTSLPRKFKVQYIGSKITPSLTPVTQLQSIYPPASVKRANLPKRFNIQYVPPEITPSLESVPVYPPVSIKRVSLPKRFKVQYIRPVITPSPVVPESAPKTAKAPVDSPFKIAVRPERQPTTLPPAREVSPVSTRGGNPDSGAQTSRAPQPVTSPFQSKSLTADSSLPPAPQPLQTPAPKADAGSIDELLSQFREHRDS